VAHFYQRSEGSRVRSAAVRPPWHGHGRHIPQSTLDPSALQEGGRGFTRCGGRLHGAFWPQRSNSMLHACGLELEDLAAYALHKNTRTIKSTLVAIPFTCTVESHGRTLFRPLSRDSTTLMRRHRAHRVPCLCGLP
jgi:hypothetical protein